MGADMTAVHPVDWVPRASARNWRTSAPAQNPVEFHRTLPGYQPTPLRETPGLAAELGVARVLVKDESSRLGLPSFKILGASWAVERALSACRLTSPRGEQPGTLIAATDGNHGRAVARVARQRGLSARIVIPSGVHPFAAAAIAAEQATVVRVHGSYDDAIVLAAAQARSTDALLVQDMAWHGYEQIPNWIVDGYTTMFTEIEAQIAAIGAGPVGLLVIPAGVGSLAQAAIRHFRQRCMANPPALLSVEPSQAACVLHSLLRERMVSIETSITIMAGLNCGTPSKTAWPYLRSGLDAAVSVTDPQAIAAARDLAGCGIPAGPCGAATLAGARVALTGGRSSSRRSHLGISSTSTIVLLSTEGSSANPVDQERLS
jgi:diaminopropionate ammonia-lyase